MYKFVVDGWSGCRTGLEVLTGETTLLTNKANGDAIWWTFAGGKANASLAKPIVQGPLQL